MVEYRTEIIRRESGLIHLTHLIIIVVVVVVVVIIIIIIIIILQL